MHHRDESVGFPAPNAPSDQHGKHEPCNSEHGDAPKQCLQGMFDGTADLITNDRGGLGDDDAPGRAKDSPEGSKFFIDYPDRGDAGHVK